MNPGWSEVRIDGYIGDELEVENMNLGFYHNPYTLKPTPYTASILGHRIRTQYNCLLSDE